MKAIAEPSKTLNHLERIEERDPVLTHAEKRSSRATYPHAPLQGETEVISEQQRSGEGDKKVTQKDKRQRMSPNDDTER